jgi:hypothetical protein
MHPADKFISRACPLMFGGGHHHLSLEDEKKLPARLRCKGFKGVLMILGHLVCVDESSGGCKSFIISQEKTKENLPITLPKTLTISSVFLKKR